MRARPTRIVGVGIAMVCLALVGCRPPATSPALDGSLLHLADHLEAAAITGAAPAALVAERSWPFDQPRPDWKVLSFIDHPTFAATAITPLADGVRLSLTAPPVPRGPMLVGGLAVALAGSSLADWETLLVRARSKERLAGITVAYNWEEEGALPDIFAFISGDDRVLPIFNDGSEQAYAIPLRPRPAAAAAVSLRSLAILVGGPGAASVDILSVVLVPRGSEFRDGRGVRAITRGGVTRNTLFTSTPAQVAYRVDVGSGGRLDFGLAVTAGDAVTYRVRAGGDPHPLFEETIQDGGTWAQRSVDLAALAGKTVDLVLEAESTSGGAVALWGAPIVAAGRGARAASAGSSAPPPNIIFYVIDGAGADLMSLYGYNRSTTPYLERLAAESAVFERAHANATWTQPSTASFMTSLQHSVLGGLRRGVHSTPVPKAATTMAEYFRRGGYETAVFTTNPNCGRVIGLERGVDVMHDTETEHHSTSSVDLHEWFWDFRYEYPGGPYWAHFQTTDVHEPNHPQAPFAGLFVSAAARAELDALDERLWGTGFGSFGTTSIVGWYDAALAAAGIDRQTYFETRRGLYDETMAHQDYQLGRFVESLKAAGEWDNTIFIVTADHGHPAGTFARFGRGLVAPPPEPWQGALFDSYATRVPLLVSWPGHVLGGRRYAQPVSLVDVLPTILDLAGLPRPAVAQGHSLAPLLRTGKMDVKPVILDEFRVEEGSGAMIGNLEIVDGRWGASLEVGPLPPGADPSKGRHAIPAGGRWGAVHPFFAEVPRLLLYDLANDPFALRAVNAEHPELVEKYTRLLLQQWQAHVALGSRFHEAEQAPLDPEQLQQLKALGYIQ
jgi:arylsulfatase A-like enzyme